MKRKGFTLVELLIVIVVIGILSAMMMLSSTEAVTSANASNIISNLRNLKTAALAYYVDDMDALETAAATATATVFDKNRMEKVLKYLNEASATAGEGGTYSSGGFTYTIEAIQRTNGAATLAAAKWYVKCDITDKKVQGKLAGRAISVGLLSKADAGETETTYSATQATPANVYYLIR